MACNTACATAGDLPAGADQDPIRDLIVGVAIALRAGGPHGDRDKQGRAGQRRSGEDKTARHWRHQNGSERSPQCPARLRKRAGHPAECHQAIVSARLSRTQLADRLGASPARRRSSFILGKRTHVAKAQQSTGRTMVLCNKVRHIEVRTPKPQQKTRRGVPPGYVAWF